MQLYILTNNEAGWDQVESVVIYAENEQQARAIIAAKDSYTFGDWNDPTVTTCELFDLEDKTPRVAHVHIAYG